MPDYGYKVVFGRADLKSTEFASFVNHPFIFDSEPGYSRLPNQFLIDRRLGVWDPVYRGSRRNPIPPARQSWKNYAYWLCNALEWAEARGIDLLTADYSLVLIGRYQAEMLAGIWSADQMTSLKGTTANPRVQIALEYQMWAADKGLREPFTVPTVTRTFVAGTYSNSQSHQTRSVEVRKGKAKAEKRTLVFPADQELKEWLNRVCSRPVFGSTEGLIAELILNTAIRLQEAACFRIDTLPLEEKDWRVLNPDEPDEFKNLSITLKYGTKGHHDGIDEHDDTFGPVGNIQMPLWLARKIHHYREKVRPESLKLALKTQSTVAGQKQVLMRSVHLFLNPETGERYKDHQIYYFWKLAKGPPHWRPHLGRDWWACRYLEERMKEHAELIKQVLAIPNQKKSHSLIATLKDTVQTIIQMEIRPQLRHANSKTTEIYLEWLFAKLRIPLTFTNSWVAT